LKIILLCCLEIIRIHKLFDLLGRIARVDLLWRFTWVLHFRFFPA